MTEEQLRRALLAQGFIETPDDRNLPLVRSLVRLWVNSLHPTMEEALAALARALHELKPQVTALSGAFLLKRLKRSLEWLTDSPLDEIIRSVKETAALLPATHATKARSLLDIVREPGDVNLSVNTSGELEEDIESLEERSRDILIHQLQRELEHI